MNEINTWEQLFATQKFSNILTKINDFFDVVYNNKNITVYPERENAFLAFKLCPLEKLKVVIIGQDPYHQPGQAHGLAFSVPTGIKLPPSLRNIFKEIDNDTGVKNRYDGDLSYLAKQGVLLLNANLTVEEGHPLSHDLEIYKEFISAVLEFLSSLNRPIVYILWGKSAQKHAKVLQNPLQLVLEAAHPSPLSANRGGFFNTHLFTKTNEYLTLKNITPIKWDNNEI